MEWRSTHAGLTGPRYGRPLPRMQNRGSVGIALHLEHELLARTGIELHAQQRTADRRRDAIAGHRYELMLAVTASLHDDGPGLGWIQIDERHRGSRIGQLGYERRYVLGHTGPLPDWIEVAEPRVQQSPFAARHEGTP